MYVMLSSPLSRASNLGRLCDVTSFLNRMQGSLLSGCLCLFVNHIVCSVICLGFSLHYEILTLNMVAFQSCSVLHL
jgi:hypothetical protein